MLLLLACVPTAEVKLGAKDAGDSGGADSALPDSDDSGLPDSGDSAALPDSGDTGGDSGLDPWSLDPGPPCELWGEPEQTGIVEDILLNEISGVVVSIRNPGVLWVMEDHGNLPEVYALDEAGETLATLRLEGVDNVDWEDLTLAPCAAGTCLVVADTGDNAHDRDDVALLVAEEPLLDGVTVDFEADAVAYGFSWPEEPEDNESLAVSPDGRFVLASKRMNKLSGIFTLPMYVDGAVAESHGQVVTADEEDADPDGAATSASMWPDGSRMLVRTYKRTREFDLVDGLDGPESAIFRDLPSPPIMHDEGVAYDIVRRGYWTIPEDDSGEGSPIWFVGCLD